MKNLILKIIDFFQSIENKISSLWSFEFVVPKIDQKIDLGSWKMLVSAPSHVIIGFISAWVAFGIIGFDWQAFLIGALATGLLLEGKDLYFYLAKKDLSMFLQSGIDSAWYTLGAFIIFVVR